MAEQQKKVVLDDLRNNPGPKSKEQFKVRRVYNSIHLVAGSYLSEEEVNGLLLSDWNIQVELPK